MAPVFRDLGKVAIDEGLADSPPQPRKDDYVFGGSFSSPEARLPGRSDTRNSPSEEAAGQAADTAPKFAE
jgi:hypothetical protein